MHGLFYSFEERGAAPAMESFSSMLKVCFGDATQQELAMDAIDMSAHGVSVVSGCMHCKHGSCFMAEASDSPDSIHTCTVWSPSFCSVQVSCMIAEMCL